MREPKERTSDAEQLRLERTAIRQRRRRDEIVVRAEEIASAKSLDGFTAGEVAKRVAAAPTGAAALTAFVRGMVRPYHDDVEGVGEDLEIMQRGAWGPELVAAHVEKLNAVFTAVESAWLSIERTASSTTASPICAASRC